jgi:hypothetical protein
MHYQGFCGRTLLAPKARFKAPKARFKAPKARFKLNRNALQRSKRGAPAQESAFLRSSFDQELRPFREFTGCRTPFEDVAAGFDLCAGLGGDLCTIFS